MTDLEINNVFSNIMKLLKNKTFETKYIHPKIIKCINKNKYKIIGIIESSKNIYMPPELLKSQNINLELSYIFSVGMIILRLILLLEIN